MIEAVEQIVGRERRGRVSQLTWCGGGCFDSRRRVNCDVRLLSQNVMTLFKYIRPERIDVIRKTKTVVRPAIVAIPGFEYSWVTRRGND